MVMLDRCASFLDERRIADARRARGFTRHAAEARVEVRDHAVIHRHPSVGAGLHHVNAAARRIHFLAEQHVARTGRQAEAAVDTFVDERFECRQRREFSWSVRRRADFGGQSHGASVAFKM